MLTLAGVLAITGIVIELLLIPIGKKLKPALLGSGVALLVVTGLVALTVALAKWVNDKELEKARKTMIVLTGVLLIVSLTMKFLKNLTIAFVMLL